MEGSGQLELDEYSPLRGANAYRIEGVTPEHRSVELWSTNRLPFEPKGLMLSMRNDLRTALRGLELGASELLHATYTSGELAKFDIENVLFYNVGTRYFSPSIGRGIRFERSFENPANPDSPYSSEAKHHHRYVASPPTADFKHWQRGPRLISWTNVPCRPIRADTNPAWIWQALKSFPERVEKLSDADPSQYGLRIVISCPTATSTNPAILVKPLIDGIICALHCYVGAQLEALSLAIGALLGAEASDISRNLLDMNFAALGPHPLVRPYPGPAGFQWNPCDEGCVAAELLLEVAAPSSGWTISGELFEVRPSDWR